MLAPQIGCSTFGSWDFMRVPAPAARMTTAAGRLTVTWRCSSIGCCVTGPPLPRSRSGPVTTRGRDRSHARLSKDTVRQHGAWPHVPSMTGITLLSVTMAEGCAEPGRRFIKYSYQETRLLAIHNTACVQSFLVPPMLFQSLPVFVYLKGLPAKVVQAVDRT